jgi:predicted Zn-dependent protease
MSVGALPGCATTSGAADKATRAAADVLLPPSDEEQLGEQFSADVEKELKLHPDEEVQAYIRRLGEMTVQAAGDEVPKGIKFEFHVVDDPKTVNAFAGPGGQIYFYSGLLLEADSAAEVMGVMCHEVAHVTKRHVAKRLVTAYGVQALTSAALGKKPGLIAELATSIATQGFLLKYSRDQERQSDRIGMNYMLKTPYDPYGFVSFFQKLEQQGASPPVFLSSHPLPGERVDTLQKRLEGMKQLPDKTGKTEHQSILERIKQK